MSGPEALRRRSAELGRRVAAGVRRTLQRPLAVVVAVEIAILALVLVLRLHSIAAAMPYPLHIDEPLLTEPAGRVLTDGDWNPHFFMYPSLPIYVTAGAFGAGYLSAASHGEVHSTADIGRVGYPFYRQPRVVWPAKVLFVLFSLTAMAGAGWVGWRLTGEPAMLALVPAVLALSKTHHEFSWVYLNVNVMGDALVWTTLAFLLARLDDSSLRAKSIVPGLLIGATTATKYNFASLALPALLAVAWRGRERRVRKAAVLALVTVATFLVAVPFAVLDPPAFLTDLGKIMGIYQDGFVNHEADPGLPHLLLNLRKLVADFGWPGRGWAVLPFALAGLWTLLRRAPAATGLVLSFPLVLLVHMSLQKAHFVRNLLSLFPLYALLVAAGLVAAYRALAVWIAARKLSRPIALGAPGALVALAAVLVLPVTRPVAAWSVTLDSRKVAVDWMLANLPPDLALVSAEELSIDLRPLAKAGFKIRRIKFRGETPNSLLARLAESGERFHVLYPVFGAGHWDAELEQANRASAEELNRLAGRLVPLQEFGKGAVSVLFDHVLAGSPRFLVGRLELTAEERAGLARATPVAIERFTGEGVAVEDGTLIVYGSRPARSEALELAAGRWRLVVLARGTVVRDKASRLRVRLGDRVLGVLDTRSEFREEFLEFELPSTTRGQLEISLTNDRTERRPDGTVADRNAYLRTIQLFSLGPATSGH